MQKWSRPTQERDMHRSKHRLQAKTVLNQYVGGFWCERQQRLDFVTGGSVIMDYELMIRPEVVSRSQTFRLPAEGLE